MTTSDKYQKLINQINQYNYEYYTLNQSSISDQEFDKLYKEIIAYEKNNPLLIDPNSPTQRVGTAPATEFEQYNHATPLLSLSNAFSKTDIEDFLNRITKETNHASFDVTIEPKIDGCAVSIIYKDGQLTIGATRGNGRTGELVTNNIKTIQSLPLHIETNQETIELRGEVYIRKSKFESLKDEFANPRNAASGALRQLDASITTSRGLDIFIYGSTTSTAQNHNEIIKWIQSMGFPTIPIETCPNDTKKIIEKIEEIQRKKSNFDFEIDGAVIKANHIPIQHTMGTTSKAPKWAIAYKFPEEEAQTTIEAIEFQVGRTGVITPVAHVSPVTVSGATIQRATLHNFDEINRLGIQVGDTVSIKRAGEVIPKITEVIKKGPSTTTISPPTICPSCHQASIKKMEPDIAYRCINTNCPAQIKERIIHFCSKNAMDIEGLGPAIIEQLLSEQLIHTIADIYSLTKDQLLPLERFAEKSADNAIQSIQASKQPTLGRFIFALGIPFIGEVTADILAEQFKSIDSLMDCTENSLLGIDQIGPKITTSLLEITQNMEFNQLVTNLLRLGIEPTSPKPITVGRLSGKTCVITGTLSQPRGKIETLIKEHGGKVVKSVSKSLDYLIVGESPGSKLEKANQINEKKPSITILSETELLKQIST